MSTGLIIAIVVVAILLIALFAVVMPRARAKAREREIMRQRDEVAGAHRERAEDRAARAEYAEQEARRERAEADLHESRARLHERGLADDELDSERERLGTADGDRRERFASERDATMAEEDRR
jgi:flagellar biosynthesis/type III secretory pathway M-ring protein FliF/YscJ